MDKWAKVQKKKKDQNKIELLIDQVTKKKWQKYLDINRRRNLSHHRKI